jgi:ABC-2 type transport system ATP-binding protein
MSQIAVQNLTKTYRVPERDAGLLASLRSLGRRTYTDVPAVRGITFTIDAGEVVGFIGPNGAGKTTTLKMLAGLLHPSDGTATVAGHTPWERQPDYLRTISMVMGNKSKIIWDVPPQDTFEALAVIYRVPRAEYRATLDELVALLEMGDLLRKPARNLSLGERMKCELVASLLHRPRVLFLDEPTIGLDVSMQRRLRQFIRDYNRRTGATVMLTSHYMADVVELCPRVILIHHGDVLYDGALDDLRARLAPFKLIHVTLNQNGAEPVADLPASVEVVDQVAGRLTLRVPRPEAPALTARLLDTLPVADLQVENPPIDAVIDQVYQAEAV